MIAPTDPRTPRAVLVGPPGAGKSTIGRKLAKELGVDLYDTDAGIERETGRTIPEIFAEDGEPEFRRIEERVVRRAILAERGVVSLGGGAVLSANTRALLRNRTVVYLEISVAEGLRRTGASNQRPLLNGDDPGAKYRELMRTRRPLYREVATVRVRTDGRSPSRVVRMILSRLGIDPTTGDPEPGTTAAAARRKAASAAGNETGSTAGTGDATTTAREPGTSPEPGTTAGPATTNRAIPATADRASTTSSTTSTDMQSGSASPEAASANRASGTGPGEGATAGSRRRPRRRRARSGGRNPASTPSNGVGGVTTDSRSRAVDAPGKSGTDTPPAGRSGTRSHRTGTTARPGSDARSGTRQLESGSRPAETGTQPSRADLPSGTDPRDPEIGAPTHGDSAPARSRKSGRRRGGSDRSRADRTPAPGPSPTPEPLNSTSAGDANRPAASTGAQVEAGGSAAGGNRSRRARARRARDGGSGARGGTSGTRGNALSVRGGIQNARGGASKQTARTESEQQS